MRSFFDFPSNGPRAFATSLLVGLVALTNASAQVSPEEHASHHPGGDSEGAPAAEPGGSGMGPGNKGPGNKEPGPGGGGMMGGGAGGMGGMMEKMGAPKPRDLYPSLISLPELTPEKSAEIEALARERMETGSALLREGLGDLAEASATTDLPAMQSATARMREGLARYDSGLAARQAFAEGKPPRDIALEWFKSEMSLPTGMAPLEARLFGFTPFHLFTMVLLVAFALAMLAMYFFKMRRAAALFGRIEAGKGPPPPGSAPELAGGKPADAPAAAADKPTAA